MKISRDKKLNILKRDNYICQICGRKLISDRGKEFEDNYFNIDHILPKSKGGKDSSDNLRALCRKCNLSRNNLDIEDYKKIVLGKSHYSLGITRVKYMCKEFGKEEVLNILFQAKENILKDIEMLEKTINDMK